MKTCNVLISSLERPASATVNLLLLGLCFACLACDPSPSSSRADTSLRDAGLIPDLRVVNRDGGPLPDVRGFDNDMAVTEEGAFTPTGSCDDALSIDSADALEGARAIGLCQQATASDQRWGVLSARYTNADGTGTLESGDQRGLLQTFGAALPREGQTMLALSSGGARAPSQPGYTTDCDFFDAEECGDFCEPTLEGFPPGYPRSSPSCPGEIADSLYNAAAFEVRIRVPTNAQALSFRSLFYTHEYPEFICSAFNDVFVVLMDPPPPGAASTGNIVFDNDGNPVSVNTSLLQVCQPGTFGGKRFACPQGTALLNGTGYDGAAECQPPSSPGFPSSGAATGWLRTTVPVPPGEEITLRFAIWDSSDADLDSTVLIDGLEWSFEPVEVGTTPDLI